nr:MAG TPA: hypothetical protein [Caudoviricetes sp.]
MIISQRPKHMLLPQQPLKAVKNKINELFHI